jgi:hypothetical protein
MVHGHLQLKHGASLAELVGKLILEIDPNFNENKSARRNPQP